MAFLRQKDMAVARRDISVAHSILKRAVKKDKSLALKNPYVTACAWGCKCCFSTIKNLN